MIGPDDERARSAEGPAFADAVTFSFADREADVYGLARVGISHADGGERSGSALAILFTGGEPVAATATGGVALAPGADFAALEAATVATTVEEPLERWTVRFADPAQGHGFALTFEAASAPAAMGGDEPVAQTGGLRGYEQLCRVHGTASVAGQERPVRCLGQRGHTWGAPDWTRLSEARTVAAWFGEDLGIAMSAVRPERAAGHDEDATWAALISGEPLRVAEPRLSTTYDAAGRQRRAGLELWMSDDEAYPQRISGEVHCGSTLDLGQLRLECAFFTWTMDGRAGVGRYDVLRRA
jgi:hypothetical protein